mmetsp:Transcript_93524/g.269304  ORF Transcript_93524/g.269304 Transcript_93524/m.269304 type:complete len:210 (+) Transcript_93524:815-1444(+)
MAMATHPFMFTKPLSIASFKSQFLSTNVQVEFAIWQIKFSLFVHRPCSTSMSSMRSMRSQCIVFVAPLEPFCQTTVRPSCTSFAAQPLSTSSLEVSARERCWPPPKVTLPSKTVTNAPILVFHTPTSFCKLGVVSSSALARISSKSRATRGSRSDGFLHKALRATTSTLSPRGTAPREFSSTARATSGRVAGANELRTSVNGAGHRSPS